MRPGDIVLINFPFTDFSGAKTRPALVVSNESYNHSLNLIVVAISTKPGIKSLALPLNQKDLTDGVMQKISFIRFQNMFAVEKRLVIKKVGALTAAKRETVRKKLLHFFKKRPTRLITRVQHQG